MKVGTRASKLARLQTDLVVGRIAELFPSETVEIVTISTGGDRNRSVPIADLGVRGVFVKELEDALLAGEVDFVVHSLKDMPSDLPEGLSLVAVLNREDRRDVLVSRDGLSLAELPPKSRLATSSRRRAAQIKAVRDDLEFVDIRGNVPTRIEKMQAGQCDAMVLAAAGLTRLGLDEHISEAFAIDVCTPAAGQGALALECREKDRELVEKLVLLDDPAVRAEIECERAYLAELGGGCSVPIGASARMIEDSLELTGCIAALDGSSIFRREHLGPLSEPEALGRELASLMLEGEARKVVASLRASLPGAISPP
ncbi:MAG: hydroxymethylbilane synthase [Candidatus Melainabacteria bacterium]|nr:hydroxymethylbilane synthase [Candidatus Melainabacteria bacterium]